MIIINQDKDLILNFQNIEAIGTGNPLEDDDGMFKVMVSTTSDNEYLLGKYKTEERTKEVLQEIINKYKEIKMICDINNNKYEVVDRPKVYEMPKE